MAAGALRHHQQYSKQILGDRTANVLSQPVVTMLSERH